MIKKGAGPARILVRCDGTSETGLGHVSRCLGLSEALSEHGIGTRFLGRFEAGAEDLLTEARIAFESAVGEIGSTEDLHGTIDAVRRVRAQGVVLDSYHVDDGYITTLDRDGAPLLLIDDFARLSRYECTAVLNFTINATQLHYPRRTQVWLLGPEYLLLRRRLRFNRRTAAPRSGDVKRVLVAMGGVDRFDLTRRAVQALLDVSPFLTVRAVVGRSYPFLPALSSLIDRFQSPSAVIRQAADLSAELATADLCVCGGGLTKYESAYLGVPSAVLSQTPDQAEETAHFAVHGLALNLGHGPELGPAALRTSLSSLIEDSRLRASLSKTGLACFPVDPTAHAAQALAFAMKTSDA